LQENSNESSSIPITLDTGPLLGESLALIAFGFGVSILVWTIQSYVSLTSHFREIKEAVKDLNIDIARYRQFVKNYRFYLFLINYRLLQLVNEMKKSNLGGADNRLLQSQGEFSSMIDKQNMNMDQLGTIVAANAIIKRQDESTFISEFVKEGDEVKLSGVKQFNGGPLSTILNDLEKIDFDLWKYVKEDRIKYSITFTMVAIVLGLVVGLSSLLQQDYVNGLRIIDLRSAFVLIGLGIGIDSLKQIIERFVIK
jgi:hypothetical protein